MLYLFFCFYVYNVISLESRENNGPNTKAAIEYFLSQDLNRILYLNIGLLGDDLSLIIQSAKKNNLFGPIKEEAIEKVVEDMISCATMAPEFLTYF